MTLNLIEALNTSLYSPNHTTNKKIHLQIKTNSMFRNSIFQKLVSREIERFMLILDCIINIVGVTPFNLF